MARYLTGDEPFDVFLWDDVIEAEVPVMRQMIEVYREHRCPIVAVERVSRERVSDYGIVGARPAGGHPYPGTDPGEKPRPRGAPPGPAHLRRGTPTPGGVQPPESTPA